MQRLLLTALLAFLGLSGCKGVDDYLIDLDTLDPETKRPSFATTSVVFDAGQLSHEGLTGLATAEEMTFWQAMQALYHGSNYLQLAKENSLLQSDGAVLIAEITTRLPIPAITQPLEYRDKIAERVEKAAVDLLAASGSLTIPFIIASMDSPDEIAKQNAYEDLKQKTGEDFGLDVAAWNKWWTSVKDQRDRDYILNAREPLRILGQLEFARPSEARAVLRVLAFWLQHTSDAELSEEALAATMRVARQTAVLSLRDSLKRAKTGAVRADIAEAMGKIRDPQFGEVLVEQLTRERDPDAAAKMVRALRFYPGRRSIVAVFNAMLAEDPQVDLNAVDTLRTITGEDHGGQIEDWLTWWEKEGLKQWP
ncbi:MAG: hypothetical protein V3W41_02615 [Planctomycetota bacterium]